MEMEVSSTLVKVSSSDCLYGEGFVIRAGLAAAALVFRCGRGVE